MSAVETELPRSKVCGCLFHFPQSLYRNVHELGLTTPYKLDPVFRRVCHKVMALAFLPLQPVRQNFDVLVVSRTVQRLVTQYPNLNRFMNYVNNTYIRGRFMPAMWNVYMRNRRTRTVFSCNRDESGDVITFTTQLNKTADCAKMFRTLRLSPVLS